MKRSSRRSSRDGTASGGSRNRNRVSYDSPGASGCVIGTEPARGGSTSAESSGSGANSRPVASTSASRLGAGQVTAAAAGLGEVRAVQQPEDVLGGVDLRHRASTPSSASMSSRRRRSPRTIRALTVPSATPVRSAISVWLSSS